MSNINFIERFFLRYYNYMSKKSKVRDCMGIDLSNFLDCNIDSLNVNGNRIIIRVSDYSGDDLELKVKIHSEIFQSTYDCYKVVSKLRKSSEFSFGIFIILVDDLGVGTVIGSADILKYGICYVLGNFGLIDSYRGKGYSKLCLYSILAIVKHKKINKLYLYVLKTNNIALSIYKSFGFKLIE